MINSLISRWRTLLSTILAKFEWKGFDFVLILCLVIDSSTCASVYWERGRSGEGGEIFSLNEGFG